MINLLDGADHFIWPLALCSFISLFIIVERSVALRPSHLISDNLLNDLALGHCKQIKHDKALITQRLLSFFRSSGKDPEQLKAFTLLEITRMKKGLFLLESIVGIAPLIGLLGTVWGLITVFSGIDSNTGLPDPVLFVEGIALALTTTILGLLIAIIALLGNNYLYRRIDMLTTKANLAVECLIRHSDRI